MKVGYCLDGDGGMGGYSKPCQLGLSKLVSKAGPSVCGYTCCVSSGTGTIRFAVNLR